MLTRLDSDLFVSVTCDLRHREHSNNIYLGIGLCTRDKLSQGIPFDIMSLIFCAEQLRRYLGSDKTYYLIADTHALITGHDKDEVASLSHKLLNFLEGIFKTLKLPNEVCISSLIENIEYDNNPNKSKAHRYTYAEIQDMNYFISNKNVSYKLGWRYPDYKSSKGQKYYDEWHFDRVARKLGVPLEYVYIKPGCSLDEKRMFVSPYVCVNRDVRILFDDADIGEKINIVTHSDHVAAICYRKYLMEIQSLYAKMFEMRVRGLGSFVRSISERFSGNE